MTHFGKAEVQPIIGSRVTLCLKWFSVNQYSLRTISKAVGKLKDELIHKYVFSIAPFFSVRTCIQASGDCEQDLMRLIESPSSHILRDMNSDALFQHTIATSDLGSLTEALQNGSNVDIESQNFVKVLELSIKNGDEAAFTKLLTYIPELRLKTRLRVADVPKEGGVWLQLWNIFRQFVISIITDVLLIIIFCSALCYALLYMVIHSTGRIQILSAEWYDRLHGSASPFSVWITLQIFYGMKHRFSREFLFDTLDGSLVFLWLAIATKFISPSSWFGGCLHEGLYSLSSFWGLQTRSTLARYMPSWRRSYFSLILGSDNFLAWTPEVKVSFPRIDHSDIILRQLLQSKCNEKALMIQFLERTTFDDIKEECGAGHEIFTWAASKGSLQAIRKLLNLGIGVDISFTGSNDFRFHGPPPGSALFWAAREGHSEVVECLLRNGAETNHTIRPPLIGATAGSHREDDKEAISTYAACVSYLLEAGADPDSVDDEGRSALSWSTQPTQKPILDLLLNAGADPNITDRGLKLPIHYAAQFGRSHEVVAALLERTINPDSVDENGKSALTWALWSADCPPTVKLLVDAVSDINAGGGTFGCPLGAASRYCSSRIMKMVLEKGADPKIQGGICGNCLGALLQRLFNQSVLECDILCLELLLSFGADPKMRTNEGKQALHTAARYCYRPRIFEVLLKHGADVNAIVQSSKQRFEVTTTPLGRSSEIAQELITRGANVAARSVSYNKTALHYAATAARSDMIKVLLEKGADANARDNKMKTPLHDACWRTPDRETLQEEDENPFEARGRRYRIEKEYELLQSIELLLTLGHADPKAKDIDGAIPLHHAIKARNPLTVETLIRLSPSDIIFETDSKGKLPLHWAAEAGFTKALYYLVDTNSPIWTASEFRHNDEGENLMKAMQESVNVVDIFGNTALHHAAKSGHEKFIAILLSFSEAFIDIDIRNHEGCTALDLAKENNHVWLVGAFKEVAEILKASRASVAGDERESRVFEAQNDVYDNDL
jgi:ankyrin repeat protein